MIEFLKKFTLSKETFNRRNEIMFDDFSEIFVKETRKAIWARGFGRGKFFHCKGDFFVNGNATKEIVITFGDLRGEKNFEAIWLRRERR